VISVFERDRRLLEYLHGLGIHPGAVVRMLASNYDDTLTLHIAGQLVQLGRAAAAKVWIEVSPVRTELEPVKAGAGSRR
jgi:DtxR family Mn-dependent transcriptional regulator